MTMLTFGKHKNLEIEDVMKDDPQYCKYLKNNHEILERYPEIKGLLEEFNNNETYMSFGKHKGKSLNWIKENDDKYLQYIKHNKYIKDNMVDLYIEVCRLI